MAKKFTHPFYGTRAWKALREAALKRDGHKCVHCCTPVGRTVGKHTYRVDHIQERKTHPHLALRLDNVRTLCMRCDAIRHDNARRSGIAPPRGGGQEIDERGEALSRGPREETQTPRRASDRDHLAAALLKRLNLKGD